MEHSKYSGEALILHFDDTLGSTLSAERQAALEAGLRAGEMLVDHFRKPQSVTYKQGKDFTTEIDSRAETLIKDIIGKRFPGHGFLGEEQGVSGSTEYQWIIDPIDGTFNYAFELPFFAVSIALVHHGNPLVGVVYDPYYQELFFAQQGQGAWLNTDAVRVSSRDNLGDAMICMDFSYDVDERLASLDRMKHLIPYIRSFRVLGSAALGLSYVACGRLDAFFHKELKPWDWAAADLLVREAGGSLTDMQGKRQTLDGTTQDVVATNRCIHDDLVAILSQVD